jgi:hypothetical protein
MNVKKEKPAVPKIIGEIISRSMAKRMSTVQVKNGTLWQSYSLHDSNIVHLGLCDAKRIATHDDWVGAVVLFRPSQQPKKGTMLPFAYHAEVYIDMESVLLELDARRLDVERAARRAVMITDGTLTSREPLDSITAMRVAAIDAGTLALDWGGGLNGFDAIVCAMQKKEEVDALAAAAQTLLDSTASSTAQEGGK